MCLGIVCAVVLVTLTCKWTLLKGVSKGLIHLFRTYYLL